jgi:hypothetical protein
VVVALIVAGVAAILAAACYFLRGGRRLGEALVHHARCPDCAQKVRYAPSRAGREAMCPRCRRRWTLPETPQPLPALEPSVRPYGRGRPLVLRRNG